MLDIVFLSDVRDRDKCDEREPRAVIAQQYNDRQQQLQDCRQNIEQSPLQERTYAALSSFERTQNRASFSKKNYKFNN